MTITQRETLEKIKIIRDMQVRKLQEVIANNSHMAGTTPSKWLAIDLLTRVHHIRYSTIKALVKQGFLELRPTDGFGPEVNVK